MDAPIPEAVAMAEAALAAEAEKSKPPGSLRIQLRPLIEQKEPDQ